MDLSDTGAQKREARTAAHAHSSGPDTALAEMAMLRASSLFAALCAAALAQPRGFVADVTSYGAKGDGVTRD